MQIRSGLNPYGLTYVLGLQGRGTDRANPAGSGLDGFLAIATFLGARTLEIWDGWLLDRTDQQLARLKADLDGLGMQPVLSGGLQSADMPALVRIASALDARLVRFALTPILCGDRAAAGPRWYELVAGVRDRLGRYAAQAEAAGLTLLIENHQDFTSRELVGLCEEFGDAVRIVLDTGNTFPVAESPLDFTRVVAPYVRHVHLKDYRAQWTDEGIRLVRCAIGDGAVPFRAMLDLLAQHHETMTAVLEPGALEARHVRFFTPEWWHGYAPKPTEDFAACLAAARVNRLDDNADWRTPWERGNDAALPAYETDMITRSAANMRALGLF